MEHNSVAGMLFGAATAEMGARDTCAAFAQSYL